MSDILLFDAVVSREENPHPLCSYLGVEYRINPCITGSSLLDLH